MTKIVINTCFGGFGLSNAAIARYKELTGKDIDWAGDEVSRDDPALVQVVEELGEEANYDFANLRVEELEAGTRYRIEEYDGKEWIETEDSIAWSVA